MNKFKTGFEGVSLVEIERETPSMVWIRGSGYRKLTTWECYFDTFADAKAHLVSKAEREAARARRQLDRAEEALIKASSVKNPSVPSASDSANANKISEEKETA